MAPDGSDPEASKKPNESLQSRPPSQPSHRACSSRQLELQRRLEKIHEEKDIIVNTMEQMVKGVDLLVAHVCSLTNVDRFFCGLVDASATMEQLYLKLFRIHLLLTSENNYVDAVQQRAPQVAITFPGNNDDSEDGDSQVTVIDGNENLQSFQSSPQHTSGASPQHLSVCDEPLGHTTSTASPVHLQQDVPQVVAPDHAVSRSVSSQTVAAADTARKAPALVANHSATPCTEAHANDMSAPMKQQLLAEPSSITGFDEGDGCFYQEENDESKWPEAESHAIQPNVSVALPHSVHCQGGQTGAAGDGTSGFTQSQDAPCQSTFPCKSAAGQDPRELVHHEIPVFYPNIVNTAQDVVLSFYKSPAEFWLQLDTSAKELESFLKKLHGHYSCSAQRRGFTAKPGMSCAAFYAEDGHWYRAKIVQVFPDHVTVYYVDFGNTDRVDLNSLCLLDKQFASLPEQALYCGINGLKVPCDTNMFSLEAVRLFRERISAPNVKLQAFFHMREFTTRYHVDITAKPLGNTVMNLSQEFLGLCVKERSPPLHTQEDIENIIRNFNSFVSILGPRSTATSSSAVIYPAVTCSMPPGMPPSSMPTAFTPAPVAPGVAAAGMAAPGFTPAGMAAPGFTPASMAAPGFTPAGMAAPGLAPACMAAPGLAPAGMAALGLTPASIAALGLTPAGMAALGLTPAGMAAPGSTPAGMAVPGLTPAGMAAPGLTPAGMAAPGSTPAGMAAPGLTPAGMAAPGLTPTGMAAPGLTPPGMAAPGMAAPGLTPPGLTPPGLTPPGLTPPGMAALGLTPPGMAAPGLTPAGTGASGLTPAGMAAPGLTPAGMAAPGSTPAGMAAPGSTPAGMAAPGSTPAGMAAPSLTPAGMAASGLTPTGMAAPGLTPPGMTAPGLTPPGMAVPGLPPPGLPPPGLPPPGMAAPGLPPPGMTAPGLTPPGLTPADTDASGLTQAGMTVPNMNVPGTASRCLTPPGMAAPGLPPPGMTAPGLTPPGMAAPGLTPAGTGASGLTQAGMTVPDINVPRTASRGSTPPGMAGPGLTPAGTGASGLTQAGMTVPNVNVPGTASRGSTPPGMAAPGLTPAGTGASGLTQAGMTVPNMNVSGTASRGSSPPGMAAPGLTPTGTSASGSTQAGMTVPNTNAPGTASRGLATHGMARPGYDVSDYPLPGLGIYGLATPGLATALVAQGTHVPTSLIQEISAKQVALSRSTLANMAASGMTAPATPLIPVPFPVDLLPPVVVPPATLPEGNTFPVILSVVFNPTDFYGQIVDKVNTTAKVLEELQQHLNLHGVQTAAPAEESVAKGSFWTCFYEGDKNWYRVQILDVIQAAGCRRFRVLYVDYGNRTTVGSTYLRPLPHSLSGLPACAYRMALALVAPKNGFKWDPVATGLFVQETGFKAVLIAEKKGLRRCGAERNIFDSSRSSFDSDSDSSSDEELCSNRMITCLENVAEVVLWNRNGEPAVNINAYLVEQDVAVLKPASDL